MPVYDALDAALAERGVEMNASRFDYRINPLMAALMSLCRRRRTTKASITMIVYGDVASEGQYPTTLGPGSVGCVAGRGGEAAC